MHKSLDAGEKERKKKEKKKNLMHTTGRPRPELVWGRIYRSSKYTEYPICGFQKAEHVRNLKQEGQGGAMTF